MKDLSYLQAFSPKILREARRIMCKGFTVEDIDKLIGEQYVVKYARKMPKEIRKEYLAKSYWGKRKP